MIVKVSSLVFSRSLFTFLWWFNDSWLLKRSWLGLYIIFFWVVEHNWWMNWEVRSYFIFVTISYINVQESSLVVEVERSWPLKGSDNDNTI